MNHVEKHLAFMAAHPGLYDDRRICVCANAKKLPNGSFGLVLLSINGNIMTVHDIDFAMNLGAKLYTIKLSDVSNVKTGTFILNPRIKFTYNNERFSFTDFGIAKQVVGAFLEETTKS